MGSDGQGDSEESEDGEGAEGVQQERKLKNKKKKKKKAMKKSHSKDRKQQRRRHKERDAFLLRGGTMDSNEGDGQAAQVVVAAAAWHSGDDIETDEV
eukprot:COSAG05_NODE_24_length_31553_cov_12.138647_7_plen_97_part_00